MTNMLHTIQTEDTASAAADFFHAAAITLAGLVALLTVATTF